MSPIEIWLRLMAISSLNGEQMLQAAGYLVRYSQCPADIQHYPYMNAVQKKQFLSLGLREHRGSYVLA